MTSLASVPVGLLMLSDVALLLLVPSHWSSVHGLVSGVQAVPFDCFKSAGQVALEPLQFSAMSHSPPEARHTVVEGWKASGEQAVLDPSQVSATSQTPAEDRQTVPAAFTVSAGHAALDPVQFSAASHTST